MTCNSSLYLRKLLDSIVSPRATAAPVLDASALDALASLSAGNLSLTRARPPVANMGNAALNAAFSKIRESLQSQRLAASGAAVTGGSAPLTTLALERINLALQTLHGPERRKSLRFPYAARAVLEAGGATRSFRALDISREGLRLHGDTSAGMMDREGNGPDLSPGSECLVTLPELGSLRCTIRNRTETTLNLAFTSPTGYMFVSAMAGILLRLSSEQEFMAAKARELALQVEQVFEAGIRQSLTSCADLFDTDFQLVPDTMPHQFTTCASVYYEAALPELLASHRRRIDKAIYVVATTREGYVPVHDARWSLPQRIGDEAWNLRWARNRRIYHDVQTCRAARFAPQALVQGYPRDLADSEPDKIVLEASAPVFVRNRRWGCVQIAFACNAE
jgi:methyl-accepting chemotaxis protein